MNNLQVRRLDPMLLPVFSETLKHGKLTEAAKQLGLTPSAVGHAVDRLRDLLGDPLFVRRP